MITEDELRKKIEKGITVIGVILIVTGIFVGGIELTKWFLTL